MGFAAAFTVTHPVIAAAQEADRAPSFPARAIKIIVPFPAGGPTDINIRILAQRMGEDWRVPVVIENRPGANTAIGAQAVARAEPDGYTLIVSGMPSHVLAPAMNRNAGFDPVRDFTHIAYLGGPPNVFAVHNSSPVKTFKELLALMRAQKDGMEYVSPSIGSVGNMVAEYVAAREHIRLTHVVYRGGGAAILDLVAGHVKLGSMTLSTMREHIRAGTLRPLAISSAQRVPELPDVPTLVELGYPELVVRTWYGLSGPAGLSPQIVDEINTVVNKSMQLPKVQEQLAGEAIETKAMTPAEFTQFMQDEVNKWVPAVNAMNLGAK